MRGFEIFMAIMVATCIGVVLGAGIESYIQEELEKAKNEPKEEIVEE